MLKCIIIDDDEMSIRLIRSHLEHVPGVEIIAAFNNHIQALTFLQGNEVDFIFIDIRMTQLTGLSLLEMLQKPPLAILTSAQREFILDTYDYPVVEYLLKPFSFNRFVKAVSKVMQLCKVLQQKNELQVPVQAVPIGSDTPFVYIKSDRQHVKVLLDEIQYIESMRNHVRIFTDKGTHLTLLGISEMESKLPAQRFLRVHKGYIVALGRIEQFSQSSLVVARKLLPIGQLYKKEVLKKLSVHVIQ
jgi:two-component system, LytTR family, response regulator